MALDLSTLLYTTVDERPCFLHAISLNAEEREDLLDARKLLRDGLRDCLRTEVQKVSEGVAENARPKFVTQGSFSYKTINSPCRAPQQADLDDGIYLPLSYVQGQGQPAEAADVLFNAVAKCALSVAASRGWTVHTDNPRCIRVVVAADKHIDIPLYSIPDDEFTRLVEARAANAMRGTTASFEDAEALDWSEVSSDRVLLATRDEGWLPKDPRPIRDWVQEVVARRGEQLRRVMRYMKAWRDHQHWTLGDDPKSIMLMVAVERAFGEVQLRRDDLALLSTSREMADIVNGSLPAPWDNSEDLTARLDRYPGLRADVVDRLRNLSTSLDFAINSAQTSRSACDKLREALGSRVPDRPDLILMASATSAPIIPAPSAGGVGRQNNA